MEASEYQRLERSFTELADNAQWLTDNRGKTGHATTRETAPVTLAFVDFAAQTNLQQYGAANEGILSLPSPVRRVSVAHERSCSSSGITLLRLRCNASDRRLRGQIDETFPPFNAIGSR